MTGMYEEEDYIEDRSCCRAQVGCLCGTSSCRLCCRFCPSVSESTSTRIVYIVFLMFSVVIMALMMSIRVQKAIMGMFPDHSVVCEWIGAGKNCEAAMGYMAVYRLGFAVSCYHFLLMLITCVWMYTAMSGAALFIVIQLMLLVFMYHSWTDKLMARVDNGGSPFCWYGVFSLTAATIVYSACACCVFLMYYYFTLDEGWDIICWLIFINVAACIVVSLVALSKQGPKDFRLRLLHSSLISLYVMYLTWTAIASVPHNYRNSDKWENSSVWIGAGHDVRSDYPDDDDDDDDGEGDGNEEKIWAEEILPYVSLALTLITVMYSVVRTATPDNCQAIEFPSCPSRQSIQRYDVEDIGGQKVVRNESNGLAYSYPLFHVMLSLATLFLMMSLTDWYTPSTARLLTFGRSWSAVWVKMSSSWVCLVIYFTVTIFPTMLPSRNYRTSPVSGNMGNGYAGSIRGSSRSLDDEAAVPLSPSKPTTTVHQETTV
ncbi:probable serine incorporator isoform X2 [Panulirus ornatus]|uniref:probable serine incorporator isoform X2 n=1 Tax=Panulirus ornatus TaxID=150431 RepID=UPI003A88243F